MVVPLLSVKLTALAWFAPAFRLFRFGALLEGRNTLPFRDRAHGRRTPPRPYGLDLSEVALQRHRLDRRDVGVVPAVAQPIDHSDDPVELLGEARQDLGVALPVDLPRQRGDVPRDLDADAAVR